MLEPWSLPNASESHQRSAPSCSDSPPGTKIVQFLSLKGALVISPGCQWVPQQKTSGCWLLCFGEDDQWNNPSLKSHIIQNLMMFWVIHLWSNPLSLPKTHRQRSFQHSPVFSILLNGKVWHSNGRLPSPGQQVQKDPLLPSAFSVAPSRPNAGEELKDGNSN